MLVSITDVQSSISYLYTHLGGEASRTIAGFLLTSVNYYQFVDLLKNKFHDAIENHVHAWVVSIEMDSRVIWDPVSYECKIT